MTKSILLAEDDKFLRRAAETKLKQAGFDVRVAVDGDEALAQAREQPPDLMLLDLLMPKRDGLSVLKALKADAATAAIRVVIISNSSKDLEMQNASDLGAVDYWIKSNLSLQETVRPRAAAARRGVVSPPATILLAEDDRILRKAGEATLKKRGYAVIAAVDGEDALAKAREHKPDLILLDVIMPKLQGFEVLASLKSDAATRDIPVIMLSNLQDESDVRKATDAGALDYLVKSNVPLDVLAARIAEALARPRA